MLSFILFYFFCTNKIISVIRTNTKINEVQPLLLFFTLNEVQLKQPSKIQLGKRKGKKIQRKAAINQTLELDQ